MSSQTRDVYVPAESWRVIVDTVAPSPRGMDAFFVKALEQFNRYSATISGDVGDSIRRCHKHLDNFLKSAQAIVTSEAGEQPGRLGKPREYAFGPQTLHFQTFHYKGSDCVNIQETRLAQLLTNYDLFHDTMNFMEHTVENGELGIFKNSFLFIHKPLMQCAALFDEAIERMPLLRTAALGLKADPNYVHIAGTEPCSEYTPGHICRTLKPGYAYEKREIQEGVVIVAANS
jgi:hypothetical protein